MLTNLRKALIPGGFGAGVGAAIAMMLVMALLRFTSNTISVPELMEESLIRLTGGRVEAFFINLLGVGGKALLLVSIIEGTLLLGGLLGIGFTHLWLRLTGFRFGRAMSGLLYGLVIGLLLNAVFLPLVNQGFFGSTAIGATAPPEISEAIYGTQLAPFGLPVFLSMFLLSVVFGLALTRLLRWPSAVEAGTDAEPVVAETTPVARRDFLKGASAALLGGVVLFFGIRRALQPPPDAGLQEVDLGSGGTSQPTAVADVKHDVETKPTAGMDDVQSTPPVPDGFEEVKARLVPEITPTDSFYITTKNFVDPTVDGDAWRLNFKGMVDNPYTLTLKDILALPSVDRIETLACISNPVGGGLIGNANWKGVNFADLLQKAGPQAGVVDVVVRGADGYSDSFPLEAGLKNECVLVYEMNGKPLTAKHGYPVRLLVPGIYGMKNCKWITDVELVDNDFKGYWESQGWSDTAPYQTMSRIDYPDKANIKAEPVYIGGVAFAGDRGIKRVEVSTDGGKTWKDANLRRVLGKYTWTQWTYPWKPEPGNYTLQVRATDGAGEVQTARKQDTYPDGATGYHTKQVRVA